ncbi:LacI family transcriptional regulator [Enterococcus sp. PF1-24]|uniref:LacI family DNA-binding transcriptional regulator n=1 Tax=unclassified Enterococcus TaxID=2608891 RepID=UPI0024765288|nr:MULTISPECIES: LacI family DNA-binding transcriptional regulator [unclassified Enterococcus]MDH6365314.1 LacI family transcriptional regulator [Enterococcus sp. PFB1-1]MDH6402430.1 LacI family transcriptional regulator [Enterococcus sp. PF1-24]
MRATIREVAKVAGVSIATVSKVFNGYSDVNHETKERILEVAKQLDYAPNMAARTLSSKKQQTIALILNELNFNRKSTMPLEVLDGVHEFTEQSDYEFVFYGTSTEKQKDKTFRQFCYEHNISGVVIQGLKMTDPYYQEIRETNLPTVLIDIVVDNPKVGTVAIDNEAAAYEAVDYLIRNNHHKIGMINGSRNANVSIFREAGYRKALERHHIVVNEEYIQYANYEEDIAYFITKNLLNNHSDITALFCASDIMAIGAMRAIKDMGKNVPGDISIIGFDDIVLASYVTPTLTSVAQDMQKIGYEAAALLTDIINKEMKDTENFRIIPHEIKYRESVKEGIKNAD